MNDKFRITLIFAVGSAFFACTTTASETVSVAMSTVQPASSITHNLTGTIRRTHENGIDVINGVQLALRLTYIVIDTDTVIQRGEEPIPLQELQMGELVTVSYRNTERGKVATHVTVQPLLSDYGSDDGADHET